MNAYWMLKMLRENLAEVSEAHWKDAELLRKLNLAQKRVANMVYLATGDWLVTSANLTPVSSVVTLPSNCAKPVYMEEASTGREVLIRGTVRERRQTRPSETTLWGGFLEAYPLKDVLEINQEGYEEEVTLWYQERVVDLHAGTADGGGATSITLEADNEPSALDDYYNDATIEVVSGTGVGSTTISDYVGSTRVATTAAGSFGSDSVYGTVSIIPPEGHDLIVLMASLQCFAKPSSDMDVEVFRHYRELAGAAKKDFEEFIETRESGSLHIRITEYE